MGDLSPAVGVEGLVSIAREGARKGIGLETAVCVKRIMYLSEKGAKQVHYVSLAGWGSFLAYIILAGLVGDDAFDAYWSLVLIPLYLTIMTVPVVLHLSMLHAGRQISPVSMKIGMGFMYSMAVLLCFTLLLQGLNRDTMDIAWSITFIPFWTGLALFLALIVFMFPVMTKEPLNKKRELVLMVNYLLGLLLWSIFTALKADTGTPDWWSTTLAPLWIAFTVHFVSFWFLERSDLEIMSPSAFPVNELVYLLLIAAFTVLLAVKADTGGVPASVVVAPIGLLIAFGVYREFRDYYQESQAEL